MKKWLWAYCPIFIICLALNLWGMYYQMFLSGDFALVTGYVGESSYSSDKKYFIDVEYFSNENNNGIENFGMKLNYYTDTEIPPQKEDGSYGDKYMYSSGVQFENGLTYSMYADTNNITYYYGGINLENCIFYNSDFDSDLTFSATNEFICQNKWVYDVLGELFLIHEVGNVRTGNFWWIETGVKRDTSMMVAYLYDTVKSLPDGERVIKLDLSQFYNIYPYNKETGCFELSSNVIEEDFVFVDVHVNRTSNGLVSANQSMFKNYMGKTDWTLYGEEIAPGNYWQANTEYKLTLDDFTFTYENGGYYLKLQSTCIDYLSNFKNMRYLLELDLDNIYLGKNKLEIDGFSKNAFGDLKINKIILRSTEKRDFKIFSKLNIEASANVTILEVSA